MRTEEIIPIFENNFKWIHINAKHVIKFDASIKFLHGIDVGIVDN